MVIDEPMDAIQVSEGTVTLHRGEQTVVRIEHTAAPESAATKITERQARPRSDLTGKVIAPRGRRDRISIRDVYRERFRSRCHGHRERHVHAAFHREGQSVLLLDDLLATGAAHHGDPRSIKPANGSHTRHARIRVVENHSPRRKPRTFPSITQTPVKGWAVSTFQYGNPMPND